MPDIIRAKLKLEGQDTAIASTTLCAVPVVNQKLQVYKGDKIDKYMVVDVVQVIIDETGPSTLDVFVKHLKD